MGAYGNLNGVFVTADGALGTPFTISGPFSHFPSVAYSPDINGGGGGFLVTWHLSVGNGAMVRGKIALTSTGVVGPEIPISVRVSHGGKRRLTSPTRPQAMNFSSYGRAWASLASESG